jgi:PIN domain nuclease of toxin-antitoxin system
VTRLLLDVHAFYWWTNGSSRLSTNARQAIADPKNEKYVSAIAAWEIIVKYRGGKEPGLAKIAIDVTGEVAAQGFFELPITMRHAEMAANLPYHHRDPADRFLIGQAMVEDMTIITTDTWFPPYGVKVLW